MSGFLYFLDGLSTPVTDAVLDGAELRYALERAPMHGPITGRTPSGGAGTILADQRRLGGRDLAYRAAEQTWRRRPARSQESGVRSQESANNLNPDSSILDPPPSIWVGFWNDAPPTPDELARERQLPGELVALAGGVKWLVPRLRFWASHQGYLTALPTRVNLDEQGEWITGDTDDQFAAIDKAGDRLYEGMVLAEVGKGSALTTSDALNIVSQLLSINYVVGRLELAMLGALTTDDSLKAACRAAMDWDTVVNWMEKKTADGEGSMPPGREV